MVKQARPRYPAWAKQQKIEGVVRMNVTIDKDGTVKDLGVVSGREQLIPFAVEAVQEWRYCPRFLNGTPVEVRTQVDVSFNLHQ